MPPRTSRTLLCAHGTARAGLALATARAKESWRVIVFPRYFLALRSTITATAPIIPASTRSACIVNMGGPPGPGLSRLTPIISKSPLSDLLSMVKRVGCQMFAQAEYLVPRRDQSVNHRGGNAMVDEEPQPHQ